MSLVRCNRSIDPLDSLYRLQGDLFRVFERPLHRSVSDRYPLEADADDRGYTVRLTIPGVAPERVNVEIRDHVLSITVAKEATAPEEAAPECSRTVRLPSDADPARAEATHRYGVLTVLVPRREEAQPRQIAVSAS